MEQAFIGFEIAGVSYEQVFMTVSNLVPDAVLGINFLQENIVVINSAERRFDTRLYSSNCEHNLYDSLPKDKMGVALIPNPEFQLSFPESQTTK
jgi:hypothetical protein